MISAHAAHIRFSMTITKLTAFTLAGPIGADALAVSISCVVDTANPAGFQVRGALSEMQAKEIGVRVRSAIQASGLYVWPIGRVTVTVGSVGSVPATKLHTAALDLPIALAIMGVSNLDDMLVLGELGVSAGQLSGNWMPRLAEAMALTDLSTMS